MLRVRLHLHHVARKTGLYDAGRYYQPCTINSVTKYKTEHVPVRKSVLCVCVCVCVRAFCLSLTLDGPLEEGLAGLTGGHAIVVARGHVTAHQTQPLGHRAQHEFTLHLAFFLPKSPG